jgi:hypothetical protein
MAPTAQTAYAFMTKCCLSRAQKSNFRDFHIRADSLEAALAEIQQHLPGYTFLGTWTSSSIPRGGTNESRSY